MPTTGKPRLLAMRLDLLPTALRSSRPRWPDRRARASPSLPPALSGRFRGAMLSPEGLRDELQRLRDAGLTAYNVNFFCHAPPVENAGVLARWQERLAPHRSAWGIGADAAVRRRHVGPSPTRPPT